MFRKSKLHGGAIAAVFASTLALAGCGHTPGDRIVSGGLLGAGGGAAIGSLYGDAGRGAVIGGVGGAALGALSTPRYYGPRYYGYGPRYYGRCARYSSYSGRCVAWY